MQDFSIEDICQMFGGFHFLCSRQILLLDLDEDLKFAVIFQRLHYNYEKYEKLW